MLLKTNENGHEIPRFKDFPEISNSKNNTFLFSLDEIPCFLVWDDPGPLESTFQFIEISFFRKTRQQEVAWVCITGLHLFNWYTQNKFCGKCGARTQQKPDERALLCPQCNTTAYPKISPAVIVAIISSDKILLARNANFPGSWYSLLAGYADVGESLEETVIREVKEEAGLDVHNIRYYKSQPWPLSGSLMIGFVAEADEKQPIVIDANEITEAAWFQRGELPSHPHNISIAGEMIERFERGEL
ncbi:MAG: NAD(+) diphosphatase [Bacteroidales bacterium]